MASVGALIVGRDIICTGKRLFVICENYASCVRQDNEHEVNG